MATSFDAAADLHLNERLCLALYTASRAMTARYRPSLSALGLTYPQYLVMVLLWEEGDCSVGQVGARLSLESSTLSPLLKRMEAIGLVTRTRGVADERAVTVGLTDQGRALESRAAGIPAEICEAAGLTVREQGALVVRLRHLADKLKSSPGETTRQIVHD
jgi:DNA-binding MarR family transcriptional regulator